MNRQSLLTKFKERINEKRITNQAFGPASSSSSSSSTALPHAISPLTTPSLPSSSLTIPPFITTPSIQKESNGIEWSEEQMDFFQLAHSGKSLFLTGDAGTGKSFALMEAVKQLRDQGKNVALTATSGIVAVSLQGVTIHSFAGVGYGEDSVENYIQKLRNQVMKPNTAGWRWKHVHTLVIDETSMLSAALMTKLERIARALRGNSKWFGGIQVIVCGDFGQLPPVSKRKWQDPNHPILPDSGTAIAQPGFQVREDTPEEMTEEKQSRKRKRESEDEPSDAIKKSSLYDPEYAKLDKDLTNRTDEQRLWESDVWNEGVNHIVYLTKVFRQDNVKISKMFRRAKEGGEHLTKKDCKLLRSKIKSKKEFANMCKKRREENPMATIPTYLHARSDFVQKFNQTELDTLSSETEEYIATAHHCTQLTEGDNKKIIDEELHDGDVWTSYFKKHPMKESFKAIVENIKNNLLVQKKMRFRVGAQVMLKRNLDVKNGLSNGSRGIIVHIGAKLPESLRPVDPNDIAPIPSTTTDDSIPPLELVAPPLVLPALYISASSLSLSSSSSSSLVKKESTDPSDDVALHQLLEYRQLISAQQASLASVEKEKADKKTDKNPDEEKKKEGKKEEEKKVEEEQEYPTIWVKFKHLENPIPINAFDWKRAIHSKDLFKDEKEWQEWIAVRQMPLILAWAVTIHSSQGMTIDELYGNLGKSVFEQGQAYVLISRIKVVKPVEDKDGETDPLPGLYLEDFEASAFKTDPKYLEYDEFARAWSKQQFEQRQEERKKKLVEKQRVEQLAAQAKQSLLDRLKHLPKISK